VNDPTVYYLPAWVGIVGWTLLIAATAASLLIPVARSIRRRVKR
jgi:hypothetical protein